MNENEFWEAEQADTNQGHCWVVSAYTIRGRIYLRHVATVFTEADAKYITTLQPDPITADEEK